MKKKIFFAAIAVVLIVAISVAGTLAVMTKTTGSVTNTFTAKGGIIDPEDTDAFTLKEHEPTWNDTSKKYTGLSSTEKTSVTYDHASPKMEIPKDPTIKVNLMVDASAYLFVKVEDTTGGFITSSMASGWNATAVETGTNYKIYAYSTVLVGTENSATNAEYPAIQVLAGGTDTFTTGKVTVTDYDESDTTSLTPAADGTITFGALTFTAYLVQAEGFDTAAAAWAGSGFAA